MALDIRFYRPKIALGDRIKGDLLAFGVFSLWIIALVIGNFFQFLTLLIYPISKRIFHEVNRRMAFWFWALCHHVAKFAGVEINIHATTPIPDEENVIVVANHQAAADIFALFALAYQKKRLGDIKWFVKEILRWVPGIGHGMMFLGCIFLNRNWTKDRDRIERTFRHIVNSGVPFWITLFAEGTRIKPSKQQKSDLMAARYHMTPFKHVLFPATKGFLAATQHLKGRLQAVYDVTIHYPDGISHIWYHMHGQRRRIDLYVTRHPIDELPESTEELAEWLVQRYAEKEALLAKLKGL